MNETITATSETSTDQAPPVEPRTITYPLRGGGQLVATCPDWCTYDHTDDAEFGIEPTNLYHHGDKIGLEYSADGVDLSILEARLVQWPFDSGEDAPYIEFIPEGRTAASLPLLDPLMVGEEIRKVRGQLRALEELGDRLSEAQAKHHARRSHDSEAPWLSLTRTDLLSMPVAYLLKVFGVTVVETEDTGRKALVALHGEPGAMELRVKPDVPQHLREDETRRNFLDWYEARLGGAA
ncbi:hypothetical protein F7R91_05520 [Streptomyces luteolifulvus]|uniref:Uncharacterized protein n=1 Tax=Streptomyces luteolifulvus TaxID=2615112 RepID=A0A6H9V350_9ACTN|nr:hypothetical protein [Streptomyces luteolifulvus]KAB1149218.1 hypothetical protein F7R91_05520 [Streptomyces luteolifulvus]